MINLYRTERPIAFFGAVAGIMFGLAVILAIPLFVTFMETGLVPRIPTAILCTGLVMVAFLNGFCGLILDTVTRGRREIKRHAYLYHPAPPPDFRLAARRRVVKGKSVSVREELGGH